MSSVVHGGYDNEAFFHGSIPQRVWKRRIAHTVWSWCPFGERNILDVGGGSSPIIGYYNAGISIDSDPAKVRYNAANGYAGVNYLHGDATALEFEDDTFEWVFCIEVLEHVPDWEKAFSEIARVLKPFGMAIIATPDYSRWRWRAIEAVYKLVKPGAYCDDHVSQLNPGLLMAQARKHKLVPFRQSHIFGADYVLMLKKRA